jgi:hypothetical protein
MYCQDTNPKLWEQFVEVYRKNNRGYSPPLPWTEEEVIKYLKPKEPDNEFVRKGKDGWYEVLI